MSTQQETQHTGHTPQKTLEVVAVLYERQRPIELQLDGKPLVRLTPASAATLAANLLMAAQQADARAGGAYSRANA